MMKGETKMSKKEAMINVSCSIEGLVNMAFSKNKWTVKDALIDNIDNNPDYIEAVVMDCSSLTSDVVENLTVDDWEKALEIVNEDNESHGIVNVYSDVDDDGASFSVKIAFDEDELRDLASKNYELYGNLKGEREDIDI